MRFKTHKRWTEETVAIRLAHILSGEGAADEGSPPWQSHGETWQLDRGNDWFMSRVGENEYELRYRYGNTPERQAGLESLASFLTTFLFV